MKMIMQDEMRKGPWTEQEDVLLINFVQLFGDRRWDFIAKVSGLNRSGKSCRLRWVNYLHPGLKRGKMTPQEEKLVLELHAKWGNRWSRIARRLPGRTDNEIKNYWRTHMRKKAQERKKAMSSPSPSSSSSSSSSSSKSSSESSNVATVREAGEASFYDTGGKSDDKEVEGGNENGYSMDDIWKDIENSIVNYDGFSEEGSTNYFPCPSMVSPPWDYCDEKLWTMDDEEEEEEESKMVVYEEYGTLFLTG